jgi:ASC-1-like (ASCH) protein
VRTKTLWVRDPYLQEILSGRKTVEVRVAYKNIARLRSGDRLLLNDRYRFLISRISTYDSFDELLMREDIHAIAPGATPAELLAALRALYPTEKEELGVVALEIEAEHP